LNLGLIYDSKDCATDPISRYTVPGYLTDRLVSKELMKGLHSRVCAPGSPTGHEGAALRSSTPCDSHFSKLGSKVTIPCGMVKSITDSLRTFKDGERSEGGVSGVLAKARPVATGTFVRIES
jgi:hypothetical protein